VNSVSRAPECFHCGEALPDGPPIYARLDELSQPVCCHGCKAVAEFIHGSGFDAFYEHRSRPRAELGLRVENADWRHYDEPDLLQRYVHRDGDCAEATVEIGGIYCSACVWLLDNALGRLDAIESISVNPATRRAVLRWDTSRLSFAELLGEIARLGFKPAPTAAGLQSSENPDEQRGALRRLIVAAAAGMQVMMFAVALYAGNHYGIDSRIERFLRGVSLLVCVPIVLYSARPFFASAWRGLRAGSPGMDLPVSLAVGAAFLASAQATLANSGEIYFDSVAMFVLFLSAARYLEMRARHRADDHAQALATLLPETVARVAGGQAEIVSRDRLRVGDVVLIRPGDVIPADGVVTTGNLAIDESMLTGESLPVTRKPGMDVFAGAINRAGNATVELRLVGAGTSLAEIGRLLERARADRPPVAELADRIATHFVFGILLVAAITWAAWSRIDPARAFEVMLATLVVTCPCALALATPAALASAASALARDGFLLVRSRVLEVLAKKPLLVFDKTGTLTEGRPAIVDTAVLDPRAGDAERCRALAAGLETASEHVLARAFAAHHQPGRWAIADLRSEPGRGVEASVAGRRYRVGSLEFVAELGGRPPANADSGAMTRVWLGDSDGPLARFDMGDAIRADARDALAALRADGFVMAIASGDSSPAVQVIARSLGIADWHAGLTPAGKLDLVAGLRAGGRPVVMIGDGINDAPVLQSADASIAMDAGTALARASADAIVLGKRLTSIVDAARAAVRTRRVIRQNVGWAVLYNLTAVPLAASGMLAPWMAALGMSGSSLLVVFNALRLQRRQPAAPASAAPDKAAADGRARA